MDYVKWCDEKVAPIAFEYQLLGGAVDSITYIQFRYGDGTINDETDAFATQMAKKQTVAFDSEIAAYFDKLDG